MSENTPNSFAGSQGPRPGYDKPRLIRDIDFFNDISGTNAAGRTKAIVSLRWFEKNSDNTETEIREIPMLQKPIVQISKHLGYVKLYLDFGRRIDVDFNNMYNMIMDFFSPLNSVSYTMEELETGVFNNGDGTPDRLVYYPLLQIMLSPIGKETDYLIMGMNPFYFGVCPRDLSGEPTMIQMVFEDHWFVVDSKIDKIDVEEMKREVIEEIQSGEAKNFMHP